MLNEIEIEKKERDDIFDKQEATLLTAGDQKVFLYVGASNPVGVTSGTHRTNRFECGDCGKDCDVNNLPHEAATDEECTLTDSGESHATFARTTHPSIS